MVGYCFGPRYDFFLFHLLCFILYLGFNNHLAKTSLEIVVAGMGGNGKVVIAGL